MRNSLTDQIVAEIRRIYVAKDDAGVIEIDPAYLAADTMKVIDPNGRSPELAAWAATLALRQLARAVCARNQKDETKRVEADQEEMFADILQSRYPCQRNGRDVYVRRSHMTRDEYEVNIARMSNEAVAKQRHSDALRAEMEAREARGDFALAA